jgi:hypothetical protein
MKDDVAFIREILQSALWNVRYHEKGLVRAYSDLAFAKEMMKRGDFDESVGAIGYDNDDEDAVFDNVEQFAYSFLGDKKYSVEYHEERLKEAQTKVAFAKIMLARGNYTEIDIEEVTEEVKNEFLSKRAV